MKFQDILEKRQSIRKFKEGNISKDEILEMIEAARLAPSGKNLQNWHFAIVQQKEIKNNICRIIREKNYEIVERLREKDSDWAERFKKFAKHFTLFWDDTDVSLLVIYSTQYTPTGYEELKAIGEDSLADIELFAKRNPGMQSLGAAIENITLKAIELGYGSCWLTSANYAADEIEEYLKEKFDFEKEGYFMAALLAIGLPAPEAKSPKKKSIEEIATFL
ncbi:MAG: nitroreductase family protein [Anaerovoracaceae bacterium]